MIFSHLINDFYSVDDLVIGYDYFVLFVSFDIYVYIETLTRKRAKKTLSFDPLSCYKLYD